MASHGNKGKRGKENKYLPEFREESIRLVVETQRPIIQVAREAGISPQRPATGSGATKRTTAAKHPVLTRVFGHACENSNGATLNWNERTLS